MLLTISYNTVYTMKKNTNINIKMWVGLQITLRYFYPTVDVIDKSGE